MPSYDIAGVLVEFPFEAYTSQLVYMEKVVLTLEQGANALLESPTGTGKTLCLLCAALGWRRAQVNRIQQGTAPTCGHAAMQSRDSAWANDLKAQVAGGAIGRAPSSCQSACATGRAPRVIYASRTHSQLQQVVRELRRTAHRPLICMLGSREQLCCHDDVSRLNGHAQTAACQAHTAANTCLYYRKLQEHKRKSGIVPHPQAAIEGIGRPVPDIEDFVSDAKQAQLCPFYLSRELQTSSEVLFMPYNYLVDAKVRRALNIDLSSDILIFDEAHNIQQVCADAASFNLSQLELAGAVREIDRVLAGVKNRGEAADADAVDAEMDVPPAGSDSAPGGMDGSRVQCSELVRARQIVLKLDESFANLPLVQTRSERRYVASGHALAELLATAGIDQNTYVPFAELCDKCVATLGEAARFGVTTNASFHLQKLAEVLRVAFDVVERPAENYRLCVQELPERGGGRYGSTKHPIKNSGVLGMGSKPRTLGYWCFHSGTTMRALMAAGVRSMLLTSGTLSPLSSFADELGLPFVHQLENPHVINPNAQLLIGTVPQGPSGLELTSSYNQRESEPHKKDLGDALVNFARLIPNGVLVFFPSYSALQSAHAAWMKRTADDGPSVLERIKKLKTLVIEPRDAAEVASSVQSYRDAVQSSVLHGSGGAMLFAVCRGRLSEGVDFADAACRGVIIAGLPLPPIVDAKVELKRQFLDERRSATLKAARTATDPSATDLTALLSGEEWYHQQAMRSVNQAVGRVIRHVDDYGAVLLCESRFRKRVWADGLSLWLRPHLKQFTAFGQAYTSVQRFFKLRSAAALATAAQPPESMLEDSDSLKPPVLEETSGRSSGRAPPLPPPQPPPSLLSALAASASTNLQAASTMQVTSQCSSTLEEGRASASTRVGVAIPELSAGDTAMAELAASSTRSYMSVRGAFEGAVAYAKERRGAAAAARGESAVATTTTEGDGNTGSRSQCNVVPRGRKWTPRDDWRSKAFAEGGGITLGTAMSTSESNISLASSSKHKVPSSGAVDCSSTKRHDMESAGGASSLEQTRGAEANSMSTTNRDAVSLLSTAKSTLPEEAYTRFMGIVRELLSIQQPKIDGKSSMARPPDSAIPQDLLVRLRSLFSEDGREALRERFLRFVPAHLVQVRNVLASIKAVPAPAVASTGPRGSKSTTPTTIGSTSQTKPRAPTSSTAVTAGLSRGHQHSISRQHAAAKGMSGQSQLAVAPMPVAPAATSAATGATAAPMPTPVAAQMPTPVAPHGPSVTKVRLPHQIVKRDQTEPGQKRAVEDAGAMESDAISDRGQEFMKEVKRRFNADGAYRRFKEAFREALLLVKTCAKAYSSAKSQRDSEDCEQERQRYKQEGIEALHTIRWLLSDPCLARSPSLAAALTSLLPQEFASVWQEMTHENGRNEAGAVSGGKTVSDRPVKAARQN